MLTVLPVQDPVDLVVKLQSELDLPRIIRSIARGSDFTKAGTGEVARFGDRNNTVTTEIRSVEVRMVEDVEELRSELQPEALGKWNILEHREIHTLERRSGDLVRRTSQS